MWSGYIFYRDSTFSFQSSVKMKLLCVQVIKDLIGSEIDVSAVVYLWFPIITEEKQLSFIYLTCSFFSLF